MYVKDKYPGTVEPGDLFVVNTESEIGGWIAIGQRLIDGKYSQWTHAGVASRLEMNAAVYADEFGRILPPGRYADGAIKVSDHTLYIVEAQPHGAVEVPWHWQHLPHAWSTEKLPSCPKAAEAALKYAGYQYQYAGIPGDSAGTWNKVRPGVGYSFLDYGAIATHEKFHFDVPGLRTYIADTGHMICSQLADQCRQDGGSHLFKDGRWPGYVKPSDIGFLIA